MTLAIEPFTLNDFGSEPIWLIAIKAVVIFAFLVILTLMTILFERKWIGWMQTRPGPNQHGPWGLLQTLADGLKLAFKEDIMPRMADKAVYFLAPAIACTPAIVAWAVIPIGPTVSIFGERTPLQLTDFPVSVLFILAMSSMGVYGIVLAGWASGSTYPLLGGLRSAAQMISYEVAMGLSIVTVLLTSGSLSTSEIVNAQQDIWYFIVLLPSFVVYAISAVGETNRAPFDLPEAESELVGGFHTEYSSLKFALFFLGEYINMFTVSAVAVTLFFGGWRAPFFIDRIWDGANSGWVPVLWFLMKVTIGLFVFVWLRGTLPRLRYDQFMKFGWKVLVPVSLVWTLVVAAVRTIQREYSPTTAAWVGGVAGILVIALLVSFLIPDRKKPQVDASVPQPDANFPTPPIDLVVPPSPRLKVTAGATSGQGEK